VVISTSPWRVVIPVAPSVVAEITAGVARAVAISAAVIVAQDGLPAALPCRTAVEVPRPIGVDGAPPAPPPSIILLLTRAALVAHVVPELKYGMPPLVPATVNAGVVVGVATEIRPPVKPTLLTDPPDVARHPMAPALL
jgi:hypothetical protein